MDDATQKFLDAAGRTAKVVVTDKLVHTLQMVEKKFEMIDFKDGKGPKASMIYTVYEDNQLKEWTTSSPTVAEQLGGVNAGDVFTVQMITINVGGKPKNTYQVYIQGPAPLPADAPVGSDEVGN